MAFSLQVLRFSSTVLPYRNTVTDKTAFLSSVADSFDTHYQRSYRGNTESTPYLSHTLGTSALVLQMQGSQNEAIAANLHDVLEKDFDKLFPGKQYTLSEKIIALKNRYGADVTRIILECSDPEGPRTPHSKLLKGLVFTRHPEFSTPGGCLVKLADLVNNLEGLNASLQAKGLEATFTNFKGNEVHNPILASYLDYLAMLRMFKDLEITNSKRRTSSKTDTLRQQYRLALLDRFLAQMDRYFTLITEDPSLHESWQNTVDTLKSLGKPKDVLSKTESFEKLLQLPVFSPWLPDEAAYQTEVAKLSKLFNLLET